MVTNLSKKHSVICHFIAELRSVHIQKDRMRFRANLRRFAACVAYEISKQCAYEATEVETPLGIAKMPLSTDRVVIGNILRAGMPMHEGMLEIFDQADSAYVGAFRNHHKDGSFEIQHDYLATANLQDAVLVLCDPMLATGASARVALDELLKNGTPSKIHLVCAIASTPALEFMQRMFPDVHIWAGDIDDELTAKGYIVPGLGDAGDLAFGPKES
jgi:uracil phosphoribosyltransferase